MLFRLFKHASIVSQHDHRECHVRPFELARQSALWLVYRFQDQYKPIKQAKTSRATNSLCP